MTDDADARGSTKRRTVGVGSQVDIDSVDPAYAPGTGTSEPGGLSSAQLLEAMDHFGGCDPIGTLDLMEVPPKQDPPNRPSASR